MNEVLDLLQRLGGILAVVFYVAIILWTYKDARRRIDDPILVATATATSVIPIVGVLVYMLLRPSEYLDDRQERELEIRMMKLQLGRQERCPNPSCRLFIEHDFLSCPRCATKLREQCVTCDRPLDPSWVMCPHCETEVPGRTPPGGPGGGRRREPAPSRDRGSSSSRRGSGSDRSSRSSERSRTGKDSGGRSKDRSSERDRRSSSKSTGSETVQIKVESFGPDEDEQRKPAGAGARDERR